MDAGGGMGYDRWDVTPKGAPAGPVRSVGGRLAGWLRIPPAQARKVAYLLVAAAAGVALMGWPDASRRSGGTPASTGPALPASAPSFPSSGLTPPPAPETEGYGARLERETEAMLGLMDGVGNVKVMITFESGTEQVLAYNETLERRLQPAGGEAGRAATTQEERSQRQVALTRDTDGRRETPVVLFERFPAIRGVMVVADGAKDPRVRLAVQRAVAAALGVSPYRISVDAKRR